MAIVFPAEGDVVLLRRMLKQSDPIADVFHLQLYTNNYSPVKASVLANFTPVVLPGYASIDLDPDVWTDPLSNTALAQSTYGDSPVSFTVTSGSVNCYGYYVTDPDANFVLWAERFPAAPFLLNNANPIPIWLVVQLGSLAG